MFPFSQSVTPAVQDHMRSQFSFISDMSQKMFDTAQRINELNLQVAKAVIDESLQTTQQVLAADDPMEAISIATGQVQPTAEKVRAYGQHLTNIAAGAKVEMTRAVESRVPEATRTAAAVAEEVTRRAAEETQKTTERQKAMMEKISNPVKGASTSSKGSASGAQPGAR